MTKKLVFLKTEEDFRFFGRSKTLQAKNLRIKVRFNTNQNTSRFGFIISKKTLPNVTDRNKVKRRLKSIVQKHLNNIKPADYLLFPTRTSIKLRFPELENEFLEVLASLKTWVY
jgi:ribonuclease P protein component